jgi:hypothetical protein
MDAVPTVYNKELNNRIRNFVKRGYKPIYNWCSPVMHNQFDHAAGDFQLIQYSLIKKGVLKYEIVWQVYLGQGKVVEYTRNDM